MSRRALWPAAPAATTRPAGADPAGVDGADQSPTAAPTVAPSAPVAPLPGRSAAPLPSGSAVDVRVALARVADLHAQLAETYRRLSEIPLPLGHERALMCDVEKPDTLLTVSDVALRLSLSERTVRRLRRKGDLPTGIEVAGTIRWRPEEIERWLA